MILRGDMKITYIILLKNIISRITVLRLYCPDLNPIGDGWVIKKIVYKTSYNSVKELIKLFEDKSMKLLNRNLFL